MYTCLNHCGVTYDEEWENEAHRNAVQRKLRTNRLKKDGSNRYKTRFISESRSELFWFSLLASLGSGASHIVLSATMTSSATGICPTATRSRKATRISKHKRLRSAKGKSNKSNFFSRIFMHFTRLQEKSIVSLNIAFLTEPGIYRKPKYPDKKPNKHQTKP
jgi:hypothetical protein